MKKAAALLLCLGTVCGPVLRAQQPDSGEHNMKGVTDVTGGMHYLLQNDDLVMLQVKEEGGVITTSVSTMNTEDSKLSGKPQTTTLSNSYPSGNFDPTGGVVASQAIGRMYNTRSDLIATLNARDNGTQSASDWLFTLFDPLTGFQESTPLNSRFHPHGTVSTQVVMGDFTGDGLADPLVFYASAKEGQPTEWGLKVFTASDPKNETNPTEGPELYSNEAHMPVSGTIVVGDFNGDGRDEIAALLTDHQTIVFYSVNPKTLDITRSNTLKLPNLSMVSGQVALAAGRFRSSRITNADLVVFGQIDKYEGRTADYGYSIIPIMITAGQDGDGSFTPTVVQKTSASVSTPYFRFNDKHHSSGALAYSAPLAAWPQMANQQLVLGIKTEDNASYIEIGSFKQDDNLDDFDWESETERKYSYGPGYLLNMSVGNFDNRESDGTHNPRLQIETYEVELTLNLTWQAHIHIFDVDVPSPFSVPVEKRTDWLKKKSDNSSDIPLAVEPFSPLRADILVAGDLQGRSLRLGAPTIARITSQIQPDVVLAIPPMHVDWIPPKNLNISQLQQQECDDPSKPCLLNVSVYPDPPPSVSALGFDTIFKFDSSSKSRAKQSSTTSWGIAVKQTTSESASFNDGLESASESIKNTVKAAHDGTVKNTYDTYKGTSSTLSVTTGFTDHILYTQKDMNVYYYPVLGCDGNPNCRIDHPKDAYVVFSVPDNVMYNNVDSTGQDWYQPVHEYGNVLSYPWSETQLQNRFTDDVTPLTQTATCMALGTGGTSSTTTWNQGSSGSHSSGSTNSFSDELSMSYSEGVGVEGLDGADFNYSLDIAANTSLNTLNESISSLDSSEGIAVTTPDFSYTSQCCNYGFGQYIFGLKSKTHPASEDACTSGQTSGCVSVNDPEGNPVAVGGTGPLFTGYTANPLNNNPQSDLSCSGNSGWWTQIYTKPDVALNHPERWNWSPTHQSVSFNPADRSYPQNPTSIVPIDQQFYTMKGFYIARKSAGGFSTLSLPSGPSLTIAKPDDQLSLTTRVYNYSLVDTTAPVHVRFYGQLYCSANGSREKSCTNWTTGEGCRGGNLCGDSFQIGQDQIIPSIAGFESAGGNNAPNWQLARVDFQPTQFPATKTGNLKMVFWVAVWMQDADGNPIPEMEDHGLISVPGPGLKQITQVATESHSNNVGMYPVHQFFQILPADAPPQAGVGTGSLKSISLSSASRVPLGQRTKVVAAVEGTAAQTQSVNIAYYDGDPAKDGKLIDVQKIAYMDPDVNYYHRTFFTPAACGAHTLYAKAWVANSPAVQATTATTVTLDAADFVQAMINSTKRATIADATLRNTLLTLLNTSLQYFQQGQTQAGQETLGSYVQELAASNGNGISSDSANHLIGQSNVALGCGSKGFSLSALPSTATVSAGSTASYSIAVTPSGGFNDSVALTCSGAPQGASCDISSQSVTLDGVSQSRVTVTVTTSSKVRSAGMIVGIPASGTGRLMWFLMLLAAVVAIGILQRGRLRYSLFGCVLLITLLSISGCGSNSNRSTPSGYYPLTVQATSGNTTQIVRMSLHVQ